MEQKTIEGTWEEVTRWSRELTGHRVRLTVLDEITLPGPGRVSNGTHLESEPEESVFEVLNRSGLIDPIKSETVALTEPDTHPPMLDQTLAYLLEEAERLAGPLPPAPDTAWTEAIVEKYRRQGFNL